MTTFSETTGTTIILANSSDHGPAAINNLGTRTDQINLTSVAAAAARQSAKFDFLNLRGLRYTIKAAIEFDVAPTAGETVDFYLGFSHSATAGTGNPGNLSGSDAAYTGYSSNLVNSLRHLLYVGSLSATVQLAPTAQVAMIGSFVAMQRYGILVVHNNTSQALEGDAVEMSVALIPIFGDGT
jgi:hypothetical protein